MTINPLLLILPLLTYGYDYSHMLSKLTFADKFSMHCVKLNVHPTFSKSYLLYFLSMMNLQCMLITVWQLSCPLAPLVSFAMMLHTLQTNVLYYFVQNLTHLQGVSSFNFYKSCHQSLHDFQVPDILLYHWHCTRFLDNSLLKCMPYMLMTQLC